MTYQLYQGDCLEFMRTLDAGSVNAVITDPPYPDYLTDEYGYFDGILLPLSAFTCRQFVFWTSKVDFPLDYTAIHIWDKKTGAGSEYERIFERNGQRNYKVFRYYFINSTVAASFTGDVFTGHSSQKPVDLLTDLIEKFTNIGATVFDPFMGSGSVGVACVKLGRKFIGCEKNKHWYEVAEKRISEAAAQPALFTLDAPKLEATQAAFSV